MAPIFMLSPLLGLVGAFYEGNALEKVPIPCCRDCKGSLNWLIPVGLIISMLGAFLLWISFKLIETTELGFAVFMIAGMCMLPAFLIAIVWAGENKAPVAVHRGKAGYSYIFHDGPLRDLVLRDDQVLGEERAPDSESPQPQGFRPVERGPRGEKIY
jgi:hypothetical protein